MATHELMFFLLGLILFNIFALGFATHFRTLIFLDTVATAIAAFTAHRYLPGLGIWANPLLGGLVGLVTNLAVGLLLYPPYLRFFHVNLICGLVWGGICSFIFFPGQYSETTLVIRYIVIVGIVVGAVSTVLAAYQRQKLGFNTDHLLDQISGAIAKKSENDGRLVRFIKISTAEFLLSHLLDKLLATTVGVMYALGAYTHSSDLNLTYHDLVELLAGYYYIAMGYVFIRAGKMGVDLKVDQTILLGPLGLFAALLGLPVFLRFVGFF